MLGCLKQPWASGNPVFKQNNEHGAHPHPLWVKGQAFLPTHSSHSGGKAWPGGGWRSTRQGTWWLAACQKDGRNREKLLGGQLRCRGLYSLLPSPSTREICGTIGLKFGLVLPRTRTRQACSGWKGKGCVSRKKFPRGGEKGYIADRMSETQEQVGRMRPRQNAQSAMGWGTWSSLSRAGPWGRESPRAFQVLHTYSAAYPHTASLL